MATAGGGGAAAAKEGSAKARVADHTLLDQVIFINLPKNLLAKVSIIKNTELVLDQMPQVISSLDAYMEHDLQSVPHLETVIQLLANIESCQLKSAS